MTIITRKGRSVDSPYTNELALFHLRRMVDEGKITSDFGRSLAERDHWSDEQLKWVHILVVEAEAQAGPDVGLECDLSRLYDLFEMAKAHIKYPKIRLYADIEDVSYGVHFKLYVAGPRSRYCGQIQVTEDDPGKVAYAGCPGMEQNRWFGRIEMVEGEDGVESAVYHPSRKIHGAELDAVVGLLEALVENPAEVAGSQGRMAGSCCFCGRPLTDDRSVAVGYGSTCASHYGLPWGKPKTRKVAKAGTEFEEPDPELDPLFEDQGEARARFDADVAATAGNETEESLNAEEAARAHYMDGLTDEEWNERAEELEAARGWNHDVDPDSTDPGDWKERG